MKVTSETVLIACAAGGVGLIIGLASGASSQPATTTAPPKTQTVVKVPDSCIDALNIDNQIFLKVGDALGSYSDTIVFAQKLNSTSDYMDGVLDKRSDLFVKCVEGK